jgi:hypothetical protein
MIHSSDKINNTYYQLLHYILLSLQKIKEIGTVKNVPSEIVETSTTYDNEIYLVVDQLCAIDTRFRIKNLT